MISNQVRNAMTVFRTPRLWCAAMLVLGLTLLVPVAQTGSTSSCEPDGPLVRVPELSEASGITASRQTPNRLWSHNDSGEPILFELDTRGSVTGRIRLAGVKVEDWEAVAVGPCPAGSCIYLADIGDNNAKRGQVTLYRFPEPSKSEDSVTAAEVFHAAYPDGAHDAEALLVTPDGAIFIVTKGETGPVGLYRFPAGLRPGEVHRLERIAQRGSGPSPANFRITDGTVSADGQWVALRTRNRLFFYRMEELARGSFQEARSVDLTGVGEAQGEGVAMGADGTLYLAGEGDGKSRAGTFARYRCNP